MKCRKGGSVSEAERPDLRAERASETGAGSGARRLQSAGREALSLFILIMPFTTYTTGKKITSIKGSYGCPRWFDAVYSGDTDYIRKHAKNIGKVRIYQSIYR